MSKVVGAIELLARGLGAGLVSGGVNLLYFVGYLGATGLQVSQPTWASIVVSSLVPCALAALGYAWLVRRTQRAEAYFALVVGTIVVASFEGVFQSTLPDGSLKPVGFDGLVMPMHAVVGLAAALLIPPGLGARLVRLRLPCPRWQ